MALCLPGDEIPLNGLQPGIGVALDSDSGRAFATTAGVLRKRYVPRKGDCVVGIVEIRAPSPAFLPTLAWNGATKRNRPVLEIGTLAAHPDLDTELTCIDPDTKKSWSTGEVLLGELKGGLSFEVALSAAQRLLDVDCPILDRLGKDQSVGHQTCACNCAPFAGDQAKLWNEQCSDRSNGGQNGGGLLLIWGKRNVAEDSKTDVNDAPNDAWKSVPTLLQRRGGEANAKVALQEVDKERKLVAVEDMGKGETVFKIPRHLWFTAACLTSHEVGRAALKWAKIQLTQEEDYAELCMLALLLLLEKHAEASRWADYIAALPWSSELPLTWSSDEVAKLGGASPQWYIQEKQRKLEKAYASLVECMKASVHRYDLEELFFSDLHSQGAVLAELKAACPSSADFILAFSLAHSRAMGIPSVDGDGRRWRLAMLPFADMLNHSCEPEVEWDIIAAKTKDMSYVAAQTCCDVAQGSELRISYKRAGSAQGFFATYGFIEEVQDVCCTELRLEPWDGPGLQDTSSLGLNQAAP
eukprot:symbB.v1.2.016841.t1/scaffold1278.1/size127201/10